MKLGTFFGGKVGAIRRRQFSNSGISESIGHNIIAIIQHVCYNWTHEAPFDALGVYGAQPFITTLLRAPTETRRLRGSPGSEGIVSRRVVVILTRDRHEQ